MVRIDEIEGQGIGEERERENALAHETTQKEHQIVEQEVEPEHHKGQAADDQRAVEAAFDVVERQPEERHVVGRKRKKTQYESDPRQIGLRFQEFYHFTTTLRNTRISPAHRTTISKLKSIVCGIWTRYEGSA